MFPPLEPASNTPAVCKDEVNMIWPTYVPTAVATFMYDWLADSAARLAADRGHVVGDDSGNVSVHTREPTEPTVPTYNPADDTGDGVVRDTLTFTVVVEPNDAPMMTVTDPPGARVDPVSNREPLPPYFGNRMEGDCNKPAAVLSVTTQAPAYSADSVDCDMGIKLVKGAAGKDAFAPPQASHPHDADVIEAAYRTADTDTCINSGSTARDTTPTPSVEPGVTGIAVVSVDVALLKGGTVVVTLVPGDTERTSPLGHPHVKSNVAATGLEATIPTEENVALPEVDSGTDRVPVSATAAGASPNATVHATAPTGIGGTSLPPTVPS